MRNAQSTLAMSREDWLSARRQGIGGSDAAAILGLNPYKSAFSVWADKTGNAPEAEDTEAMRIGRDLEAYVAKRFTDETGLVARRDNHILAHPEHDWMIANIDRRIPSEKAVLECKTANALAATRYTKGDVPIHYAVQCMHYMAVTGAPTAYMAVLVLGKAFHVFRIDRDEEEIAALTEAEEKFWADHVLTGKPPEPDGSGNAGKIIDHIFKPQKAVAMLYGNEDAAREYLRLTERIKALEAQKERIKQQMQLSMGDCTDGEMEGFRVRWRPQERNSIDSKRLRKDKPEIAAAYTKTTATRPFYVDKLKEEE